MSKAVLWRILSQLYLISKVKYLLEKAKIKIGNSINSFLNIIDP